MSVYAYEVCVSRGASILDEVRPDWFEHVDLARLAIEHPSRCPLGQTFGSYTYGQEVMGLETRGLDAVSCGLTPYGVPGETASNAISRLNEEWRKQVLKRRDAAAAVPELAPESVETSAAELQAFIEEWSDNFESMYVNRTAGDYSFTGYVVALMRDARDKGVQLP